MKITFALCVLGVVAVSGQNRRFPFSSFNTNSRVAATSNEGSYVADNSGAYNKNDGKYYPDNTGQYVHSDIKYEHDDDKYKHANEKFGNGGNYNGQSGFGGGNGNSGSSRFGGSSAGNAGNANAGFGGSGAGNRNIGQSVLSSLSGGGSGGAGSGGNRFGAGSGISAPSGFGAPANLEQGSASGKYDNRNYAIIRKIEHVEEDGYHYLYETENGITGEEQGKLANRGTDNEAMQASGFYTYTGPDSIVYTVKYTANENGFQPEGAHIPTPPPIPDAILRALEYQKSVGTL